MTRDSLPSVTPALRRVGWRFRRSVFGVRCSVFGRCVRRLLLCICLAILLPVGAGADPYVIPRWQLVPQSYDFWEMLRRMPGFTVRRRAHFGHGGEFHGPWGSGARYSYWEWFDEQPPGCAGYAPVPLTGVGSPGHRGRLVPAPVDVVLPLRTAIADTAVSLIRYERGDWGRESYAGSFSGPFVSGMRLDVVLWGDGWGGDRIGGADWDGQHYEGRLVGRSGWLGLRRLKESGGVLAPVNEESPYETRSAQRTDWSSGVRLPCGLVLDAIWSRDEETWRGDSTASAWLERGTAGLRRETDLRGIRLSTRLRWVHELVGGDVSFRHRELECRAVGSAALGEDGTAEGWLETRGDRTAGWGVRAEPPDFRGWKMSVGLGGLSGWHGARERAIGFPVERWRGVGLGLGRDDPFTWALWGKVGRAWGSDLECEVGERPWWWSAPERVEDDVSAAGVLARAEGSWFWVSGWGELVSRDPVHPVYYEDGSTGRATTRCVRGLADCGLRIRVREEVVLEGGASVRGERVDAMGDEEDREYAVASVRSLLEMATARLYVCVEQPTGRIWEEVPGYPLQAPMLYAGVEWTFTQ
jgi:hypothetical protein